MYGSEELKALQSIITKGILSDFRGGTEVKKFEKEFAEYIGTKYAIATSSGTAALHASLSALSLKEGSKVIVPPLTFISTVSIVLQEKLKPIFADIDDTYCLDIESLEQTITENTKCIIPVHLYGYPAKMDKILEIAKRHNLYVIEDACQAHGAMLATKKVGSFGDLGCFSFFQTKNMSCGEGGMITTSDKQLYIQARLRREHGSPFQSDTWYSYSTLGYNYNLTEIQAAIGRVQLKKLDEFNKLRVINANKYKRLLKDFEFTFVGNHSEVLNVFHNLPILLPEHLKSKRGFFVKALQAEGIPVGIAYPYPLYSTELFRKMKLQAKCPKAEDVSARIFNLFVDPTLDSTLFIDTKKAIEKVLKFLKKNER